MSIKIRLIVLNFLQFFVWGAWLISLGGYMINTLGFSGGEVGSIYATMGIASLFMPGVMGIIADKWFNAERLYGLSHLLGFILMFFAAQAQDYSTFYPIMLLISMFYMPTIALNNTISYAILDRSSLDVVKAFPPIRVWGTIGFIAAMWIVDLMGWTLSQNQLYISGGASLILAVYAFTLPKCPPVKSNEKKTLVQALGLDAFVLFKQRKMFVFFMFAMLLGAALQITNTFGTPFLQDFKDGFSGYFAVEHPMMLMSVSQMSEVLFILAIPFFLKQFGIKKVMLMSMFAWTLRFGLFGFGDPGQGLWMLVLSMLIYGLAFDFFNISGSLFVETETNPKIRGSAQGLFMIMTNGFGAILGGVGSGFIVDYFTNVLGVKDWSAIWLTFAAYAFVVGILFMLLFKYKHDSTKIHTEIKH
jgi:MFS transporter, NHS family, xanthosine permease